MNLYCDIARQAVAYIEERVEQSLSPGDVAAAFHFSEAHFSRLFRILTGVGLGRYLLHRRLAAALPLLEREEESVTGIAYRLGFAYPEVFSRDFKACCGISPQAFRNGEPVRRMPAARAEVVERLLVNHRGGFALRETFVHRETTVLWGVGTAGSEEDPGFHQALDAVGAAFVQRSQGDRRLGRGNFYSVVQCLDEKDAYRVFFGREAVGRGEEISPWQRHILAGGWYAALSYRGRMLEMRSTFVEDYYRWVIRREIDLRGREPGMTAVYSGESLEDMSILVQANPPNIREGT